MGKYMKKAKKPSGEVSAMESTTIGVRTRAKTLLALQSKDSPAYLELRSRRLEKPNLSPKPKTTKRINKEEEEEEVEVSFGENILDLERTCRETTPSSTIRDPETMGTPGSTTRPTRFTSDNRRMQSSMHRNIPTSHEIEEFFADAERLQQRTFTEKYNFDPVNDCPLPGRYEWLLLD